MMCIIDKNYNLKVLVYPVSLDSKHIEKPENTGGSHGFR